MKNTMNSRYYASLLSLRRGSPKLRREFYRCVEAFSLEKRLDAWGEVAHDFTSAIGESGLKDEERSISSWRDSEIGLIAIGTPKYPSQLYSLPDPPLLLFYQSASEIEFPTIERSVSIVGARKADVEGIALARWFGKEFSRVGMTIISGLAYGADAAAHWGSLSISPNTLPTIGVLGSGFDNLYPKAHEKLAREIIQSGGVLVSEYEPSVGPRQHHFLERNRIIAALSQSIIVIQAGVRSGALATARLGGELGRDVYGIPGPVGNPLSDGTNALICSGAQPITNPHELIGELNFAPLEGSLEEKKRGGIATSILSSLATYGPSTLRKLSQVMEEKGYTSEELSTQLSELEQLGDIDTLPGRRYSLR